MQMQCVCFDVYMCVCEYVSVNMCVSSCADVRFNVLLLLLVGSSSRESKSESGRAAAARAAP